MTKKEDLIEEISVEQRKHLKRKTIKELNQILEAWQNEKMSY